MTNADGTSLGSRRTCSSVRGLTTRIGFYDMHLPWTCRQLRCWYRGESRIRHVALSMGKGQTYGLYQQMESIRTLSGQLGETAGTASVQGKRHGQTLTIGWAVPDVVAATTCANRLHPLPTMPYQVLEPRQASGLGDSSHDLLGDRLPTRELFALLRGNLQRPGQSTQAYDFFRPRTSTVDHRLRAVTMTAQPLFGSLLPRARRERTHRKSDRRLYNRT
jgi:hypothetical protein